MPDVNTMPTRFDSSKPWNYGGMDWSFGLFNQGGGMTGGDAPIAAFDPTQYQDPGLDYWSRYGFNGQSVNPIGGGGSGDTYQAPTGYEPTPELQQWLKDKGYHYGTAFNGFKQYRALFDQSGQMLPDSMLEGGGNELGKALLPIAMFAGAGAIGLGTGGATTLGSELGASGAVQAAGGAAGPGGISGTAGTINPAITATGGVPGAAPGLDAATAFNTGGAFVGPPAELAGAGVAGSNLMGPPAELAGVAGATAAAGTPGGPPGPPASLANPGVPGSDLAGPPANLAGGSGLGDWSTFDGILQNLGGIQGLMSILGGAWGFSQAGKQAELPSMDEFLASPMYKSGEQAVTRSMMAQGYQGSGNMMNALATNSQDAYAKYATLKKWQGGGSLADQMSALGLITSGLGKMPLFGGGSAAPAPTTPSIYKPGG